MWRCIVASVTIGITGLPQAHRALRERPIAALRAAANALNRGAEEIMAVSKAEYVPVATGLLRASGHVIPPKITGAAMGAVVITPAQMVFGGMAEAYALSVHENPRSGKTGGVSPSGKRYKVFSRVGQWKYLETPAKLLAPKVFGDLKLALDRVLLTAWGSGRPVEGIRGAAG